MSLPNVVAWSWGDDYPYRPYWYFKLSLLKSLRGFYLSVITPIGAVLWRVNYPNLYMCTVPRFLLNWKRVQRLKDGGLLFEKNWSIQ